MPIISMAWTTDAYLDGSKTVTRRNWSHKYAAMFKVGSVHKVYNKSPRCKGKHIGWLRITHTLRYEPLRKMPDSDFEAEGGTRYWKNKEDFIEAMGGPDAEYWVVRFEKVKGK